MQIIEAMRRAHTTHEVCLLLSNYIETLPFYDLARRLPASVCAAPVQGLEDVETRYTDLREARLCDLARSHCDTNGAVLGEATEIFYEALCRMRVLLITGERRGLPRFTMAAPQRVQ